MKDDILAANQNARVLSEFETLLEAIPDAILRLDWDGRIKFYNFAAQVLCERIFRGGTAEFVDSSWLERHQARDVHGQPFRADMSPLARLLRGEALSGPTAMTLCIDALDGQEVYLQVSGKPLLDVEGMSGGALVVVRDITGPNQLRMDLEQTLVQRLLEQRRLQERQQRVQLSDELAEYAYMCQVVSDGQIRIGWVSEGLISLLGYSLEELEGMGWDVIRLCHPDDLSAAVARIAAMHAGQPDEREWRIITRSGRIQWMHDVCHCTRDTATGVIHIYAAVQDITERKEAEQQVWQLNQQLDATFEAMADGILVLGPDGELLRMNAAARDLLGLTYQDSFPSLSLEERMRQLAMRAEDGHPLSLSETPDYRVMHGETITSAAAEDIHITTLDQRSLTLNINGSPIAALDGRQLGSVLIIRDVSLRYQQARRKQQALLTLLRMVETLAQFPNPNDLLTEQLATEQGQLEGPEIATHLLTLARDLLECQLGCIITLEPVTERFQVLAISGRTGSERDVMRSVLSQFSLPEFFEQEQRDLLQAGEAFPFDMLDLLAPWMQQCEIREVLLAPLSLGDSYLGLICLDATGIEQLYPLHEALMLLKAVGKLIALVLERERLMREHTQAETHSLVERESSRQKDAFLRLASHELRTPLAVIKASIQIARRRIQRLYESTASNSDAVMDNVLEQARMLLRRGEQQVSVEKRLIDALLDVSRIQEERLELNLTLFNLTELVQAVCTSLAGEDHQHSLHVRIPADEQYFAVIADYQRIEQVIHNYLDNAIKYAPAETPIEIQLRRGERMARVEVLDQGPGIAAEEGERIWERFYQIPGRIVHSGSSGMGLGLYISRALIRLHHGQVGVEHHPEEEGSKRVGGMGACFWFTLPLAH